MPKHSAAQVTSLPAAYRAWRASELGRITDDIEEQLVLELVGSAAGKYVLDVGCGDGALSVRLAKAGSVVTGLDADPEMLATARERASTSGVAATFVDGDGRSLPFADSSFDAVVAVTVLCFVANPERTPSASAQSHMSRPRLIRLARPAHDRNASALNSYQSSSATPQIPTGAGAAASWRRDKPETVALPPPAYPLR